MVNNVHSVLSALRLSPSRRSAFTKAELIVVVAVLGIGFLLLPIGLPGAKESARQVQCKDNLHNIGLACSHYRKAWNSFASGGWGAEWTGDPESGNGAAQPGGWMYSLLPYLDQETLHDLGKGLPESEKQRAAQIRERTPLSFFYCPTRRRPIAYPVSNAGNPGSDICRNGLRPLSVVDRTSLVARLDYAANFGTEPIAAGLASGRSQAGRDYPISNNDYEQAYKDKPAAWRAELFDGVIFRASEVQSIPGGESQTYLFGEKNMLADHYEDGQSPDDSRSAYVGFGEDNCRSGYVPPLRDHDVDWWNHHPGKLASRFARFGSAHANNLCVAFCDGSIHVISYDIDPQVHYLLSLRHAEYMARDGAGNPAGNKPKYVHPSAY